MKTKLLLIFSFLVLLSIVIFGCTPPPEVYCDDNDGGNNLLVAGVTNDSGALVNDVCYGGIYGIRENWCVNGSSETDVFDCRGLGNYTCDSGRCVSSNVTETNTCIDSDGINHFVVGNVSGQSGGVPYFNNDSCGANGRLTEWYCLGSNPLYQNYPCSDYGSNYTCSGGVCAQKSTGSNSTNSSS